MWVKSYGDGGAREEKERKTEAGMAGSGTTCSLGRKRMTGLKLMESSHIYTNHRPHITLGTDAEEEKV